MGTTTTTSKASTTRWAASVLACATLALSGCSGDSADSQSGQSRIVTIGANPAGTHVYAVAAGLAKVLQENGGLRTTIRPFTGSSVYLPMMQRGEIALGLNTSIDSYLAFSGLSPYETPMRNLRMLAMIFPLPIMYMVRGDSDFVSIEDLRGADVVMAFRANVALEQLHTGILATGGLTPADVNPIVVAGLPEAMRMLSEGRADAVPTGLNTALALQVNASLPGGIRYLTMGADEARLAEIMPGSVPETIVPKADTVGFDAPIRVAGVNDLLNSSTALSEEQAYSIVKTIYESWDLLRRDYIQISGTLIEDVVPVDIVLPYHDGAVRYYREAGVWTDAHERSQQRLLAHLTETD